VASLTERAQHFGAAVVGVIKHVGSGTDPCWLAWAAELAKQKGAKLLFESTDRAIRHANYHSIENSDAQARDCELQDLQFWTKGVALVTDLHPDASPAEVRSYQSKRGQRFKGNRGGRPRKRKWKVRRLAWIDLARNMRDDGLSYQQIAESLNGGRDGFSDVTAMTVWNWMKRGV
jgi:hypothetical protein